jgi:X-Pro dipeptidyl-peptidase-like protein
VLDYRQWGGSDGQPRDVVSVPRQREDYRSAIGWAVEHPLIDTRRIFAWGSSFSGIHSVQLAATDSRLAGALGQSPLVDGVVAMTMAPRRHSLWLFGLGLRDILGSLLGRAREIVVGDQADRSYGWRTARSDSLTERVEASTAVGS